MAACEIAAIRPEHRVFIGVYSPIKQRNYWLIHRFELPARSVNEKFGEEGLVNNNYIRLLSLDAVEAALVAWDVNPTTLDAPWNGEYPL